MPCAGCRLRYCKFTETYPVVVPPRKIIRPTDLISAVYLETSTLWPEYPICSNIIVYPHKDIQMTRSIHQFYTLVKFGESGMTAFKSREARIAEIHAEESSQNESPGA